MEVEINSTPVVHDIEANKAEWLEARRKGIGSSDIAVVCGFSRYKSKLELWAEKTGKLPEQTDNEFMAYGRHLEPFVAELFTKKTGLETKKSGQLFRHPMYSWALASPDYFTVEAGQPMVVECKTATGNQRELWANGQVPDSYQAQLIWQLGVLGLDGGYLAGLVGGDVRAFYTPRFTFSSALFLAFLEQAEAFMQCVQQDIPPDPGAGDSQLIEELVGARSGTMAELSPELDIRLNEIAYVLTNLRREKSLHDKTVKALDDEIKKLENEVKMALGSYESARLSSGALVSVKLVTVPERVQSGYKYSRLTIKNTNKETDE